MKLNEVLEHKNEEDELLVEQQLTEAIVAVDNTQFGEALTAEQLLGQLGLTQ